MHAISGKGGNFDRDLLASPVEMFGVSSAFNVFPGRLTLTSSVIPAVVAFMIANFAAREEAQLAHWLR